MNVIALTPLLRDFGGSALQHQIVADLEAALDGARSAEMACVNDAGPKRQRRVAGAGARPGRQQPQQFSAIEEDLKES